jgi:M6 family metalloprotease-like protein
MKKLILQTLLFIVALSASAAEKQQFTRQFAAAETPAAVSALAKTKIQPKYYPSFYYYIKPVGSPNIPVLLVQFSDYKFRDNDPAATFNERLNGTTHSVGQYFADQSNGKFTPHFDVIGPVTLEGKRVDYGGDIDYGDYIYYDKGFGLMVGEGLLLADDAADFSKYDNDGDGECDALFVIVAGDGQADSTQPDAADAIWPASWVLSYSEFGRSLTLDNTVVEKFETFAELYGPDITQLDGIGILCARLSYWLGVPSFAARRTNFGMGPWSLMHRGRYNNNNDSPIGFSAYEKEYLNWIDYVEAEPNTQYTLPIFNQKNADTDVAVRITNPEDPDEFYVLENRAKQGWDEYLPTEGLLITHVTFDQLAWENDTVNTGSIQRMTVIPADNSLLVNYNSEGGYYRFDYEDSKGDLWPNGDATALTDTTLPAATVNTGGYMSQPVTDITRNDDGSISFWFMKDEASVAPIIADADFVEQYFTLQGVRIDGVPTAPGVYIRRLGSVATKHLISPQK